MPGKPTLLVPGKIEAVGATENDTPIDFIIRVLRNNLSIQEPIMKNRIFILKSETGSGKSTTLPVYLFRSMRDGKIIVDSQYYGKSIAVTEPRIITTIDNAKEIDRTRSPWNPDIVLGQTVGYQTQPFTNLPKAGITYMTLGVLTAQLLLFDDSQIMDRYQYIVLDEVHERNVQADLTILKLKAFYKRNLGNKNLPMLLLCSATIDTSIYQKYFEVPEENVFTITGSTYKRIVTFATKNTNMYIFASLDIVKRLKYVQPYKSDILIFVSSLRDMEFLAREIEKLNLKPKSIVLTINREAVSQNTRDRQLLEAPPDEWIDREGNKVTRRIIISNTVMETGITVDSLLYCVDNGWTKTKEYYPIENIGGLVVKPPAQSRVEQRKGRIGRKYDGYFYTTYTKATFDLLPKQQIAEIFTTDFASLLLIMYKTQMQKKKREEFRVEDMDMFESPSTESFVSAMEKASLLGFISRDTLSMTSMGKIASKFTNLNMEQVRLILAGYVYGVSIQDMITIATAMGDLHEDLFKSDKDADILIFSGMPQYLQLSTAIDPYFRYVLRLLFCDQFFEYIFAYNIFKRVCHENDKSFEDICQEHGFDIDGWIEFIEARDNIINEVISVGLNPFANASKGLDTIERTELINTITNIKRCIYDSLRMNIITLDESTGKYLNRHGMQIKIKDELWLSPKMLEKAMTAGALNMKPKYILTDRFDLKADKDKVMKGEKTITREVILYKIKPHLLSIMDGYVEPDPEFLSPIVVEGV